MFDYIVCFYFGNRRVEITNSFLLNDKYFFVKKHLDLINQNVSVLDDIQTIVFTINGATDEDVDSVINIKNEYPFSDKVVVLKRDNTNYSYGAWNESLIHQINSNTTSTYAFLCEDDYIFCDEIFHKKFIEYFDTDVVYVCQLFQNNHAAISNGFISYQIIKDYFNINKQLFNLINIDNYTGAEINQVGFLNNFKNYRCVDISNEYFSRFLNPGNKIVTYGNLNGEEIIKPILE
jgi:hypothetical protein